MLAQIQLAMNIKSRTLPRPYSVDTLADFNKLRNCVISIYEELISFQKPRNCENIPEKILYGVKHLK